MPLNKMQYDEVIRTYNRRQLQNKREQNERIEQVYEKVPRIQEISNQISSLSLSTTRVLLEAADSKKAMKEYKESIAALKEEKLKLLAENGFPADYMNMRFTCPDCEDSGYIGNVKCHCFKQAEINILYDQSNLKNVLNKENFDSFSFSLYSDDFKDPATGKTPLDNIHHAVNVCHHFIDHFNDDDRKYKNILMFGKTGVGKTFLTNCIARELIEHSVSVIYLSAINLFDILADAEFNSSNPDNKNRAYDVIHCDLLIIDDLGTELSNSFTNSAFFSCINERILGGYSTIISTNLIFTELMERYSERITSRLAKEYTFLKIYGDDLRHKSIRKS